MPLRLYAVAASHPCAAVEGALRHKGLAYRRVDLPQGAHFAHQRLRFGAHTVPGLLGDGVKVVGSRPILRALDELRPQPPLLPAEAGARAAVLAAEAWGDDVLQPAARRLAWVFIPRAGRKAAATYLEDAQTPGRPGVLAALLPLVTPLERAVNGVGEETAGADLAALPGWLDRVDAWIAGGTLGGDEPNAADFQVLSSVRLLGTFGDLDDVLAGRPSLERASALFPRFPGRTPPGLL